MEEKHLKKKPPRPEEKKETFVPLLDVRPFESSISLMGDAASETRARRPEWNSTSLFLVSFFRQNINVILKSRTGYMSIVNSDHFSW